MFHSHRAYPIGPLHYSTISACFKITDYGIIVSFIGITLLYYFKVFPNQSLYLHKAGRILSYLPLASGSQQHLDLGCLEDCGSRW